MRYEYWFPPAQTNSWHPPLDFGISRIRLHFALLMPKYYYQFELKICFRFLKLFVIYVWCTTCKQAEVLFCYMHSTAYILNTVCFRIVQMNKLLMGFQCKAKWKWIRCSAFDEVICIFTCLLLLRCIRLIFRTIRIGSPLPHWFPKLWRRNEFPNSTALPLPELCNSEQDSINHFNSFA